MKKFLSLLLTAIMLLSLALPVLAAEDKLTFTVGEVNASKGSDVSLTIDVSNNTGMAGVVLTLGYDTTVLTLKSYENGTVYSTVPEVGLNYVWTESGKNTTNNGTLLTLVFTVNEAAIEGSEYPVTVTVRECSDIDRNAVETITVNGKISIKAPQSKITSADMVLGTDITVNYYAKLDASHIGTRMRFTMNGTETIVDGVETEEDGVYVYAFQKVAPQCMGDNIKAELLLGDTVLDVKEEYSVKTYCENTLAKTAAELEMSAEKYAALRTLIADMLEYGAKAQIYKNYKMDTLVNEGITGQSEFVELNPEDCDEILEQSGSFTLTGVEFVSAGMYFDYYNALYVKFNAPNVSDSNFRVRLKDGEENILATYKLSDCQLISEENNTYILILPALYATQFEDFYIIELCKYSSRATTMQWSLNYGVSSYVCAKQNKTDGNGELTSMAELARATYNYGLSATAYNGIAN